MIVQNVLLKGNRVSIFGFYHADYRILDQCFYKFTDFPEGDSDHFTEHTKFSLDSLAIYPMIHGNQGSLLTSQDIKIILLQSIKEKFQRTCVEENIEVEMSDHL